jgi:hypothetical protein
VDAWRCKVKKLAIVVAALFVAAEAGAATVVLTGGKRLDVASYTISGSYVVVQYANGRRESYPASVVDLQATREASGEKPGSASPVAAGPHSPFLAARSSAGEGAVVVTDADVRHIERAVEGEEGEENKEEGAPATGSQVTLVSYEKKKVGDGEWEIAATVTNQGKTTVQGVNAVMRVLDDEGKPVATGSGSLPSKLDPGKQGVITARIPLQSEPFQVAIDLNWQEIRPAPTPVASPAPVGAAAAGSAPRPPATSPQAAASPPPGWSVPAGSSPNSLPANLMAAPVPNVVGTSAQVPRPEPKT